VTVGCPILGAGLGFEISTIITICSASKNQKRAFNIYNENCTIKRNSPTSSLGLGITSNGGIGITLNF